MMTLGNLPVRASAGPSSVGYPNLISGEAMNMSNMGFRRWALTLPSGFSGFGKDVYERGVLQRDFLISCMTANSMAAQGGLPRGCRRLPREHLKCGSQTAAEAWVRGHAVGGAKLSLRDAIKEFEKNPRSRASRQYLAYFKHLGFGGTEGRDLIAEGGEGEMYDRYEREAVVDVQGGYTSTACRISCPRQRGKSLASMDRGAGTTGPVCKIASPSQRFRPSPWAVSILRL